MAINFLEKCDMFLRCAVAIRNSAFAAASEGSVKT